jgi:hypothetical protein
MTMPRIGSELSTISFAIDNRQLFVSNFDIFNYLTINTLVLHCACLRGCYEKICLLDFHSFGICYFWMC